MIPVIFIIITQYRQDFQYLKLYGYWMFKNNLPFNLHIYFVALKCESVIIKDFHAISVLFMIKFCGEVGMEI